MRAGLLLGLCMVLPALVLSAEKNHKVATRQAGLRGAGGALLLRHEGRGGRDRDRDRRRPTQLNQHLAHSPLRTLLQYEDREKVNLWVNKVGPYNNPQETYNYYYLPFCKRLPDKKAEHSWGGLGEVLQGNELINSQLDLKFKGKPGKAADLTCG